jgi:pilus assembly protein Flp/PilA
LAEAWTASATARLCVRHYPNVGEPNGPSPGRRAAMGEKENMSALKRFVRNESGATAIEYGLIAAGISVAIITVVNTLGSQLKTTFNLISTDLVSAGK